jgi:hypothetical protein
MPRKAIYAATKAEPFTFPYLSPREIAAAPVDLAREFLDKHHGDETAMLADPEFVERSADLERQKKASALRPFDWEAAADDSNLALPLGVRREIASEIEQLVAEARMWDRAPTATDLRKRFQRVAGTLTDLKAALAGLGEHGRVALEGFLGQRQRATATAPRADSRPTDERNGSDGTAERFLIEVALETLRRAVADGLRDKGGLPVGEDVPSASIITPLVDRIGRVLERAGGRVTATPRGPFARLVKRLHDALPEILQHSPRVNRKTGEPFENAIWKTISHAADAHRKRATEAEKRQAMVWLATHPGACKLLAEISEAGGHIPVDDGKLHPVLERRLTSLRLVKRFPGDVLGLTNLGELALEQLALAGGQGPSNGSSDTQIPCPK